LAASPRTNRLSAVISPSAGLAPPTQVSRAAAPGATPSPDSPASSHWVPRLRYAASSCLLTPCCHDRFGAHPYPALTDETQNPAFLPISKACARRPPAGRLRNAWFTLAGGGISGVPPSARLPGPSSPHRFLVGRYRLKRHREAISTKLVETSFVARSR